MPTPQLLAYRRTVSHSGVSGVTLALPDYAPGYEWDDWFLVLVSWRGGDGDIATGTGPPWVTLSGGGLSFQVARYYNGESAAWTMSASSTGTSRAILAYMFAFRNGGHLTTYASGGGNAGGLIFERDTVPALPQDAIAVFHGLGARADGSGGYEASTPVIASRTIYRSEELATIADDDANFWAMWTDVQPAGSTYAPVFSPVPPAFAASNWGYDTTVLGSSITYRVTADWWWVDYAANPVPPLPDPAPLPSPVSAACPPHQTAQARVSGARLLTDPPISVRGATATVRAAARA